MKPTITIVDPVICKADNLCAEEIHKMLSYPTVFWVRGPFGRRRKTGVGSAFNLRTNTFPTGFLKRIVEHFGSDGIEIKGELESIKPSVKSPSLKGITLRKDQIRLIKDAVKHRRGILKAPTGSGKTVVAAGLMSMYPERKVLFLCHTIDLVKQAADEFKEFGFNRIQVIKGGSEKIIHPKAKIICATIQSFVKMSPVIYADWADIILIDEVHHAANKKGQYATVLNNNLAPIRIGFTATTHGEIEKALALEGLIGPVIGELSIQEGIELGIMATPKITLLNPKFNTSISHSKTYREIYRRAIVNNRQRNRMIVTEVLKRKELGFSSLILVKEIAHGDLIKSIFNVLKTDVKFVQGATDGDVRNDVKKLLNDKHEKIVICTSVWYEGINIPTLNVIVNGCGGKSEIKTIQVIGRGLRKAEGKDEVEIIDFLDPYKHLSNHSILRMRTYVENGWL